MTLNDLNDHFTLNFHYYDLHLSNYLLRIYFKVCLCKQRSAGSRVSNRDPPKIWNLRKTDYLP